MNQELISITDKALEHIKQTFTKEAAEKGHGLRIGVVGGGCSGLSYKVDFGPQKDKDNIIQFGDLKVFIDPKSSIYLKGIRLDYQDGLNGKGLVFENPNAKNTCGCGESFSA